MTITSATDHCLLFTKSMEKITLSGNMLTSLTLGILFGSVKDYPQLKKLTLKNINLQDYDKVLRIAEFIKTNTTLKIFTLYCNDINPEGKESLKKALEENKSLVMYLKENVNFRKSVNQEILKDQTDEEKALHSNMPKLEQPVKNDKGLYQENTLKENIKQFLEKLNAPFSIEKILEDLQKLDSHFKEGMINQFGGFLNFLIKHKETFVVEDELMISLKK